MSSKDVSDGPAVEHKVFRIENDQVLNLLQLDQRPGSFRYSLAEILKNFSALQKELDRIQEIDPRNATCSTSRSPSWDRT